MCLLFYIPCQKRRKYFLRLATLILGMTVPSSSQPQEETGAAGKFVSSKLSFQEKKCEQIAEKKKKYKTISLLRIKQKNPNQPANQKTKQNKETNKKPKKPNSQPTSQPTSQLKKSHKKRHCKEISPQRILASCNYN